MWEVFLTNKLGFGWDQIHDIAEELEHVKSPLLIERLNEFLDFPTHDPHGDPIPDASGVIDDYDSLTIHSLNTGDKAVIVGVNEQSPEFLQYLDKMHLGIGTEIEVTENNTYDHSKTIFIKGAELFLSEKVCRNLVVKKV